MVGFTLYSVHVLISISLVILILSRLTQTDTAVDRACLARFEYKAFCNVATCTLEMFFEELDFHLLRVVFASHQEHILDKGLESCCAYLVISWADPIEGLTVIGLGIRRIGTTGPEEFFPARNFSEAKKIPMLPLMNQQQSTCQRETRVDCARVLRRLADSNDAQFGHGRVLLEIRKVGDVVSADRKLFVSDVIFDLGERARESDLGPSVDICERLAGDEHFESVETGEEFCEKKVGQCCVVREVKNRQDQKYMWRLHL